MIPFGVASRDVCGENTEIPFADKRRSDFWRGSSNVSDLVEVRVEVLFCVIQLTLGLERSLSLSACVDISVAEIRTGG